MTTIDTMPIRDVLQLVARTRVFAGLTVKELEMFITNLDGIEFDAGAVLLQEGQPHVGLNIVIAGSVEVLLPGVADSPKARRINKVSLATLKSGDCFGEYAIFDDKPASASVVGVRPGRVVCIARDTFRTVLEREDAVAKRIYRNLLNIMVERLRASDRDFDVLLSAAG